MALKSHNYRLTDVIGRIVVSFIVESCGSKTADDAERTCPDKLVADLPFHHGVPHLVAGVVVRLDIRVAALDVVVRTDVWQAASVTLHGLCRCLANRKI